MSEPSTSPSADTVAPPALPSTADTIPYVPVAMAAVAAMVIAVVFVVLLLILGGIALWKKAPLFEDSLLFLPLLAIVLSFAARRLVRNSEGTRTGVLFGIDLTNTSWWTAVVVGLGYGAYLLAINYSIRQEAKGEVERWAAYVVKGDAPSQSRAFHRTRDPNERAKIPPENETMLEQRWRNEFNSYRQADLIRFASRNPGATFTVGGLREWAVKPTSVECVVAGTLKCAEGTFPVSIALRGVDAAGGTGLRQWQILPPMNSAGYFLTDEARFTPYGWFVGLLDQQGTEFARQFVAATADRRDRSFAYGFMADSANDPFFRPVTPGGASAHIAVLGGPALFSWAWNDKVLDATAQKLFTLPGNRPPSPEQTQKFVFAWNKLGVGMAGSRLQDNKNAVNFITVSETAIEMRVAVDIPVFDARNTPTAARGRVVIVCTDPDILAEVNKLRAAADPDQANSVPPLEFRGRQTHWRVLRIECDLTPAATRPPPPAPGPLPTVG